MHTVLKGTLIALGMAALAGPAAAQFGGPPPAPNTGIPVFTALAGGGGSGHFTGVIDPPKGTFCYILNTPGLAQVTAAHVHIGAAGANGAPVIPLTAPKDGSSGGCMPIAADLAAAILANPEGYYVNVHTTSQPAGAIRGQLTK